MIKPDFFGHLTTGMFNLIVKDPRRTPPRRAALDQGLTPLEAVRPRTCCAVLAASVSRLASIAQAALGELFETIEDHHQSQQKLLIILWIPSLTHLLHFVILSGAKDLRFHGCPLHARCDPVDARPKGFSPRGKSQKSPHSTKSQTSSDRPISRSPGQSPSRGFSPLNLPYGLFALEGLAFWETPSPSNTTASPNFLILRAA